MKFRNGLRVRGVFIIENSIFDFNFYIRSLKLEENI